MWINVPANITDYLGFIYRIDNIKTGQYYVGKKQFTFAVRKRKAGYKRATKTTIPSDWQNYWGSCKKLQKDIETLGKDNFRRTILRCCTTKFELALEELKLQLQLNVLNDPLAYNEIINVRLRKAK